MENEVNVLDELNKGACMGMDAVHFTLDEVEDDGMRDLLHEMYDKYQAISTSICENFKKYSEDEKPNETNAFNKVMTWYGIEMKTLTDNSNSKIAEMLLQGVNMGIIEGRKLLNHKDVDSNVLKLINDYVSMQEDFVEKLKTFL